MEPAIHIAKARDVLAAGHLLLDAAFDDQAGRSAYMAAFHAAMALIVARTGKEPKTQRGTHTEFARIARSEPAIPQDHVSFLSRTYGFKAFADYADGAPVIHDEAAAALHTAAAVLATIEAVLPPPMPAP